MGGRVTFRLAELRVLFALRKHERQKSVRRRYGGLHEEPGDATAHVLEIQQGQKQKAVESGRFVFSVEVFPSLHVCDRCEIAVKLSIEYSFYKKPCTFLPPLFDSDDISASTASTGFASTFKQRMRASGLAANSLRMRSDRFPFPSLWSDVLHQWEAVSQVRGGFVRSWNAWKEEKEGWKLRLEIGGNRWCMNLGRAHKSNHIYFILDLSRSCFYQKCHDLDCLHFASSLFPLSHEEAANASLYLDAEQMLNDGTIPSFSV